MPYYKDYKAMFEFSAKVGRIVKRDYGFADGVDLCYQFLDMGQIKLTDTPEDAARYVAQMIEQQ